MVMSLGEFRELTKDLPDDAHILVDDGDLDFYEIRLRAVLPPVLDHPYAIWLEMGQAWNIDLDMDARVDAEIGYQG